MIFSNQEIYEAVKNNLATVNTYVNSHGGEITLLGAKDGIVYIELIGTCKGCAMSLMTTKMVVQKELRALIHQELTIVNVDGSPENKLPNEYYKEESNEIINNSRKNNIYNKIKDFLFNN